MYNIQILEIFANVYFLYILDFKRIKSNFKVCHSSAFQTISRRSVYNKIINYSGSILANLNSTMQTKQHATKKTHSYSNRSKIH